MSTNLDEDQAILEQLDFDVTSGDKCDGASAYPKPDCSNTPEWLQTSLCCSTELKVCGSCRVLTFTRWREFPSRQCSTCAFIWDASRVINYKWSRL